MNVFSTVDVNFLSTLAQLETHLEKLKCTEHMVHSLSARCINMNDSHTFMVNVKNDIEAHDTIDVNTLVVEQASHRHERELVSVLTMLASSILEIRPSQIIHVFVLGPGDFKEYNEAY